MFSQQKLFQLSCTSITSCELHLKSSWFSNSLQKPHTILNGARVATWSPLCQPGSIQQTLHYSTQNDFPVPPFIANVVLKTHLGGQTYKTTEKYRGFFCLNPCEIPILLIKGLSKEMLMVMTTDQSLWRQKTYFRAEYLHFKVQKPIGFVLC